MFLKILKALNFLKLCPVFVDPHTMSFFKMQKNAFGTFIFAIELS